MCSTFPPLPNAETGDELAAAPKALPDLDAKPPKAEPLGEALVSLEPAEEPNALKPDPELG